MLSPILANVLLDEIDKELEKRGHAFVRYADDLNVYVRSKRAGERVMEAMRRLYARLKLRINEAKSAVARATERKFLGFSFWVAPGRTVKLRVASETWKRVKERVRMLTRRVVGRSMAAVCKELGQYLAGWKAYFRIAETPRVFADADKWVRHRLRALQLKHWKRGPTIYRELRARGMSDHAASRVAGNGRRWWHNSALDLHIALPNRLFDELGGAPARRVTSTRRTARCGPACRVVWQGSWRLFLHAPMPIRGRLQSFAICDGPTIAAAA